MSVEARTIDDATLTPFAFDPQRFLELRVFADTYAQIQRDRIALNHRLRSGSVPTDLVADISDNYARSEKMVATAMKKAFRRAVPEVVQWLKTDASVGIGEHLMARLLGTIGHPVIAMPHHWDGVGENRVLVAGEPFMRNIYKLYAYCGVGDPSRQRRRGMSEADAAQLGRPRAKVYVRLIAELAIRHTGSTTEPEAMPMRSAMLPVSSETADPTEPATKPSAPSSVGGLDVSPTEQPEAEPKPDRLAHSVGVPSVDDEAMANPRPNESAPTSTDPSAGDADVVAKPRVSSRRRSPYRDVYDFGREKYAEREGWTLGHQHEAALRLVSKAFLKDLWLVCRDAMDEVPK